MFIEVVFAHVYAAADGARHPCSGYNLAIQSETPEASLSKPFGRLSLAPRVKAHSCQGRIRRRPFVESVQKPGARHLAGERTIIRPASPQGGLPVLRNAAYAMPVDRDACAGDVTSYNGLAGWPAADRRQRSKNRWRRTGTSSPPAGFGPPRTGWAGALVRIYQWRATQSVPTNKK